MNIKKLMAGAVAAVMSVTGLSVFASAANNAGLTFQTSSYGFRNNPNQNTAYWWDGDIQEEYDTWNYTDAEITKDGQYTVSFEKDDSDGATSWNMLKLAFLISETDYPDFAVTVDSFKIDGKDVAEGLTAQLATEELKPDDYTDTEFEGKTDYYVVGFFNKYNTDMSVIGSDTYGQKVEVTFTVSGFKSEGTGNPPAGGDNNNVPNTGVEGVAAVAGLAIIAGGALIVAKKRK